MPKQSNKSTVSKKTAKRSLLAKSSVKKSSSAKNSSKAMQKTSSKKSNNKRSAATKNSNKTSKSVKNVKKAQEKKPTFLITYYSRTSTSKRIAHDISVHLNGDLKVINDLQPRKGAFNYIKAGFDALKNKETLIDIPDVKYNSYDTLIIGSPIWAGRVTPAIRTFIKNLPYAKNTEAAIFVVGRGGDDLALGQMEELLTKRGYKVSLKDTFIIKRRTQSPEIREKITSFAAKILSKH